MKPRTIEQIIDLMRIQYEFARTGRGWDEYAAAREQVAARLGGAPPETFPGTPDHPWLQFIRRLYFHDPGPTLRQLRAPALALFGELDNNILAEKNRDAWEAALKAGGHPDYTLRIIPKANHIQLEAAVGSNAEMASLRRFVPAYFATVRDWLAKRVRGFAQHGEIRADEVRDRCASFHLYLHDYRAAVGLHLATRAPHRIRSLIVQNADAHASWLGPQHSRCT